MAADDTTDRSTPKKAPKPRAGSQADESISRHIESFEGLTVGKKKYGRSAVVIALVLIGVLAAPLGVAAKWAFESITSQDKYIALVSGLAQDQDIQQAVAVEVTDRVMGLVDVSAVAGDDGSGLLGKLNDIVGTVTGKDIDEQLSARIRPLLESTVDGVVTSNQFQTLWTDANEQAHTAIIGALEHSTKDIAGLTASGGVDLDVSDILVQAVGDNRELGFLTNQVAKRGFSIPLLSAEQVNEVRTYYDLAANVSVWAPIIGILALLAALVLARKRWVVGVVIGLTFVLSAYLPSLMDTIFALVQPAALSGNSLGAQVGRHVVDQAVLNSADALKMGIPIGIGVLIVTVVMAVALPRLRRS